MKHEEGYSHTSTQTEIGLQQSFVWPLSPNVMFVYMVANITGQ
jgi:hypothetical protein